LRDALAEAGLAVTTADATGIRVDAQPGQGGAVAARHGITLVGLPARQGAGLEALFLELTAGTQPEGAMA